MTHSNENSGKTVQTINSELNKRISQIFPHLSHMTYLCLIFDWERSIIRANVEFLVDGKKVNQLLELLQDGTWRKAEV